MRRIRGKDPCDESSPCGYRRGLLHCAALLWVASMSWGEAAAQTSLPDTLQDSRGLFSAGLYYGEVYKKTYLSALYAPDAIELASTRILAANLDYRLYRSPVIPLQFELELDAARHFGEAQQYEVVIAPFLRWSAFPWNRYLYTNVRVSALGLSYTTGVSAWERQNSGQDRGSNLLQFGAIEVAFFRHQDAATEFFVRLHHRSGVYGLINGVGGGSSYLAVGVRVFH